MIRRYCDNCDKDITNAPRVFGVQISIPHKNTGSYDPGNKVRMGVDKHDWVTIPDHDEVCEDCVIAIMLAYQNAQKKK